MELLLEGESASLHSDALAGMSSRTASSMLPSRGVGSIAVAWSSSALIAAALLASARSNSVLKILLIVRGLLRCFACKH